MILMAFSSSLRNKVIVLPLLQRESMLATRGGWPSFVSCFLFRDKTFDDEEKDEEGDDDLLKNPKMPPHLPPSSVDSQASRLAYE